MMGNFNQRFTKIKGLSDRRRLPRLGSIRLGIKVQNAKGVEYPKETDYFVCPDEVKAVFGEEPKQLDVMLPLNEIDSVFPTAYKLYGSGAGLKCTGDGETALRADGEGNMEERPCPCEFLEGDRPKCKQSATLMVMIPSVSVGGVYFIRTSSYNSIVDIQSGMDFVQVMLGRFSMVPLTLKRVPTETHHDAKKQTHYTMSLTFDGNIDAINLLRGDSQRVLSCPVYELPAPDDSNPALDPVDIVADEEDELPEYDPEDQAIETGDKESGKAEETPEEAFQRMMDLAYTAILKLDKVPDAFFNAVGVFGFTVKSDLSDVLEAIPEGDRHEVYSAIASYINNHGKRPKDEDIPFGS